MEDRTLVCAGVPVTSIPKGPELGVVRGKRLPDDLSLLLEDYNHEGTHEVGRINVLVILGGAVVEQLHIFVPFIGQEAAELADVLVRVRYVQRAKVRIEWFVDELVVDVEEIGFRVRLRRFGRRDPVQFVYTQERAGVSRCSRWLMEGVIGSHSGALPLMISIAGESKEDANISSVYN